MVNMAVSLRTNLGFNSKSRQPLLSTKYGTSVALLQVGHYITFSRHFFLMGIMQEDIIISYVQPGEKTFHRILGV